ncbi:hypothetical protein BX600DRAFT_435641 [Xylariales sp. PMI_506]|nr:hypothetical protein BX600DRAFT_435641 [Xylariales sp. PMI_506]
MTTNSFGGALPQFDFPQTNIASSATKYTKFTRRFLPVTALVAATGFAAYYASPEDSWQRVMIARLYGPSQRTINSSGSSTTSSLEASRRKALQDAYGSRGSLEDLESAQKVYNQTWNNP